MKIIFVIGLPGSGKTHLAKELLSTMPDAWLIDDFHHHLYVNSEAFRLAALSSVGDLIITDPTACGVSPEKIRQSLESWFRVVSLSFIAFENDPDQCIINTNGRDDRVISPQYIRALSRGYDPARYSDDIRPVWRGK